VGESEPEALVRELAEELGVIVRPQERIWQSVTPWQVRLSWWTARLDPLDSLEPNPLEVASCVWLTPEETLALPNLLESNRQFLHAVRSGQVSLPLDPAG